MYEIRKLIWNPQHLFNTNQTRERKSQKSGLIWGLILKVLTLWATLFIETGHESAWSTRKNKLKFATDRYFVCLHDHIWIAKKSLIAVLLHSVRYVFFYCDTAVDLPNSWKKLPLILVWHPPPRVWHSSSAKGTVVFKLIRVFLLASILVIFSPNRLNYYG